LPRNVGETVAREEQPQPTSDGDLPTDLASGSSETLAPGAPADGSQDPAGRKRRRRGGRRRRGRRPTDPRVGSGEQTLATAAESGNPVAPTAPGDGSSELAPDSETAEFDSNEE
jgi:ribonuclease E